MLIRCRSKTGVARYQLESTDDISVLIGKIYEDAPTADPSTVTLSNDPKSSSFPAGKLTGTVASLGLKHGDLLFVSYKDKETAHIASSSNTAHELQSNGIPPGADPATSSTAKGAAKKPWELAVEDPVDRYWEARDGLIARPRDRMCRHGEKSMCDHCMPLEPYDAKYQDEHKIKHLSFHAYLRKLNIRANATTATSSNMFIPPLSQPDYKVKIPCPSGSHQSWPEGICTKCQPSAITLALQQFRMVDHVEFASPDIIDRLLNFWRRTGQQRFGWLLGKYEAYEEVPMGVKAVVEAIHEPPQEGDLDGLRLGLPWEDESKMESLAGMCGLRVVGMIYTDLTPDEDQERSKLGKVQGKRHAESFFLSSLEAVFAANQQIARPNASRFSDSGKFSSKFVTCVVTGDTAGDIRVEAYQIANQAMAMVEADMIEPSVDPSVVRVKDDTSASSSPKDKRYIPDVFYTYKNQYNLQVKESAKPCFPTDYLLVSLTSGFPKEATPVFKAPTASAFPIENRQGLHDQSLNAIFPRLNQILEKLPETLDSEGFEFVSSPAADKGKGRDKNTEAYDEVATWLSDWHLLAFLDTCGIFDKDDVKLLSRVATLKSPEDVKKLVQTPAWRTLATIAQEHAAKQPGNVLGGGDTSMEKFETDADGFPIIPPDHDMMRPRSPSHAENSSNGPRAMSEDFSHIPDLDVAPGGAQAQPASSSGIIVCPHCTFENPAGATDCEICSLPLA